MLNRPALLAQLQTLSESLFVDIANDLEIAQKSWVRIGADSTFVYKVRQIATPWLVPDWYDVLGSSILIDPSLEKYTVLAVDGSQIYPDRHQGTSCFLINIGSVILRYGYPASLARVELNTQPFIFAVPETDMLMNAEQVDCKRQELELEMGVQLSRSLQKQINQDPFLFLFDGSLIFWHLESKDSALKDKFLHIYLQLLEQLYQINSLCAGYISLPKSKELVNLIRIELTNFNRKETAEVDILNHIVDTTVSSFYLKPQTRSIIFKSNAKIGSHYPDHLTPYFFYCDTGFEIARIEIPAWIALDSKKLNEVATIILNQVIKGRGYPVALAEAHEQAVVKGPDRDFFYHLLHKMSIEQRRRLLVSQKSMKKRGIGI